MPAYSFARNSSASIIAANDPFTIFGETQEGVFANNKLDPKASFFSRVSSFHNDEKESRIKSNYDNYDVISAKESDKEISMQKNSLTNFVMRKLYKNIF